MANANRNNGIDLFRLIAAFFVMCLHTSYGSLNLDFVNHLRLFSRWAAPFFFIVSGFFLGKKIENGNFEFKRIQKNVFRLFSLLIVSNILYIPVVLLTDRGSIKITDVITADYSHLWFIWSLLIGYVSIYAFYSLKMVKTIPFVSALIILLALFMDSYDQFLDQNLNFSLSQILLSIPFMYIGVVLSKKEKMKGGLGLLIGLICAGLLIQVLEGELIHRLFDYNKYTYEFLIGTIVVALSIFITSSRLKLRSNLFSKWGKDYSLFIYLYHPQIYFITWIVLRWLFPVHLNSIMMFSPIIGFSITLILAIVVKKYFPKFNGVLNGRVQLFYSGEVSSKKMD